MWLVLLLGRVGVDVQPVIYLDGCYFLLQIELVVASMAILSNLFLV